MTVGIRLATIQADIVAAGDVVLVDNIPERVYVVRCDTERGRVRLRFARFMRHYLASDVLEVI